jgi:peptidoglycan/xylan/chitin deacetylase (PgdA/CDA1 family)
VTERIFSFRWDIDHLYGLEKGVPSILSVFNEFNAKCSFYINLGKAFDLKEWAFKSFKKSYDKLNNSTSINIIQKLGYLRLLRLIVFNPNVGLSRTDILKRIVAEGHELGLHGAMNHMVWSRRICDFAVDDIERMLQQAIVILKSEVGVNIFGFAAPGFRWTRSSLICLDRLGFSYNGDLPGNKPFYPKHGGTTFKQLCVPVTLIGPNAIPIIEYHSALGKDDNEVVDIVCKEIERKEFAVIYGHPVFEGFRVNILGKILRFVLDKGYEILRHDEVYERFKHRSAAVDISSQETCA